MTGLPAAAESRRDALLAAADRHRAAASELTARKGRPIAFSWIGGRRV